MKKKQSYENLPVWIESLELVKDVYQLTSIFPEEDDILVKKLHKEVVGIPTNIAKAMLIKEEQILHLKAANINIIELQTVLVISENLGFIDMTDVEKIRDKSDKIDSSLQGLVHKLNRLQPS